MKKELLTANTVISLGIMFLVGGCVMILVITQSNSGTGRSPVVTNSSMDLSKSVADSNNKDLPLKTKKSVTPTKHDHKAISDITKRKEGQDQKPANDREPSPALK